MTAAVRCRCRRWVKEIPPRPQGRRRDISAFSGRDGLFCPELVREEFDHLFFDVDIKGQLTDEGVEPEKLPVFFGGVREGFFRDGKLFHHILFRTLAIGISNNLRYFAIVRRAIK